MKRIVSLLLLAVMLVSSLGSVSYAGDYPDRLYLEYDGGIFKYNSRLVTIDINGVEVKTGDMPAVIIENKTLVPVREVFESEAFGAEVNWNQERQEIAITYEDRLITMQIDSDTAYVNGQPHELEVAPKLVRDLSRENSKTMIPLRFVSEVFDFEVSWDGDTYTAALKNEELMQPEAPEETTTAPEVEEEDNSGGLEFVGPSEEDEGKGISKDEGEQDEAEDKKSGPVASVGEKLDGLTGESASRPLPTPLKDSPIQWSATEEALEEISESYVETAITDEEHSETQIKRVSYDDEGVFKTFTIEASSAISEVDYFMWDGKFIMDFTNAINKLPTEQPYEDNPILSSIRASQYSLSPNEVRIVFDLIDGGSKFELSFNDDRTKLMVKVMDNSIYDILLAQNKSGDYIQVTGAASPDVKMFRLSQPDRIVIDFPNTISALGFNESEAEGQYITKIRTAQFDPTTTRIVVETDGQADYEITKAEGGETVIQFMEPGYENIEYANDDKPTIALVQDDKDIVVDEIIYENDYRNHIFRITLPEDYGDMFGDGSLKVNDGIIETIETDENDEGHTEIVIKSTQIYEYRIEEEDNKINIKAYKPKELYDQIVVIDVGHGGKDPGAIANGLYEKDVNLDITFYLKEMFDEQDEVQVYYTRLIDEYPTLQERCDLANEIEADMFLSIHNNAYNPSETGTETLYFPSSERGKLTSPILATIFQQQLTASLGSEDRGIKQRENLFVLKHTAMPAVILEIGFLTNANDSARLKDPAYLQEAARALYKATFKAFDDYPTKR